MEALHANRDGAIILPKPHAEQRQELAHDARFKISVHGRRWGKSILGMIASLCGHGHNRRWRGALNGGKIWWVAPNYKIAELIWRLQKGVSASCYVEKSELHRRVVFPSNGEVVVKSADNPVSLRGEGIDGVMIDEAAYIQEDAWYQSLRPALSDRGGWAWFISTPKGTNWLYRLWSNAESDQSWGRFQSATTTATVSKEELVEARKNLGEWMYNQEYEAKFLSSIGQMFKREWFKYYRLEQSNGHSLIIHDGKSIELSKSFRFCTVDLAASTKASADYTVVSSFAFYQGNLYLLDSIRARMEGPDQVPLIKRAYERWRPAQVAIEKVGYQLALIQAAQREGLPIVELVRDRDKVSRACLLQARLESGNVLFPDKAPFLQCLENELLEFPNGEHDDQVDTLSDGAAYAANRKTPRITVL